MKFGPIGSVRQPRQRVEKQVAKYSRSHGPRSEATAPKAQHSSPPLKSGRASRQLLHVAPSHALSGMLPTCVGDHDLGNERGSPICTGTLTRACSCGRVFAILPRACAPGYILSSLRDCRKAQLQTAPASGSGWQRPAAGNSLRPPRDSPLTVQSGRAATKWGATAPVKQFAPVGRSISFRENKDFAVSSAEDRRACLRGGPTTSDCPCVDRGRAQIAAVVVVVGGPLRVRFPDQAE